MILTITPNPSVDISYSIDTLKINDINRCSEVRKTAGGKGLNVTRVLNQLGAKVNATGFVGGFLGDYIVSELDKVNIQSSFVKTDSSTRNCIAILHDGVNQTEVLESSEKIDSKYEKEFMDKIGELMSGSDIITCSGSLPSGISDRFYTDLVDKAVKLGKKIIVDTSGNQLEKVLFNSNKPFAIKPNTTEILDLFNTFGGKTEAHNEVSELGDTKCLNVRTTKIDIRESLNASTTKLDKIDDSNIAHVLSSSLFDGIELVLVSAGGDGGYFKYNGSIFKIIIPNIDVLNPVGSGDSTVAGLSYSLSEGKEIDECIKTAMTCGMLNARESMTGYINIDHFDEIYSKIIINKI